MRNLSYFFLLATVFLGACQKTIDDFNVNTQNPVAPVDTICRITNAYYYGGSGGLNDSTVYTYTGNQLTRVEGRDEFVEYVYNGSKLFSLTYTEKQMNQVYRVDTFYYAGDLITQIRSHDFDQWVYMDSVHAIMDFNYTGTQLNSLSTQFWHGDIPSQIFSNQTDFTWENGNIVKLMFADATGWTDSVTYSFDTLPNYFKNVGGYFFMNDPFFELQVGFDAHIPYFLSTNNVTGYVVTGLTNTVAYEIDSRRNPVAVNMNGFEYMKYKYLCE